MPLQTLPYLTYWLIMTFVYIEWLVEILNLKYCRKPSNYDLLEGLI